MTHFDDIVIGAGQAGIPLAVRLASEGRKVALFEQRVLGGTCVNDGCIPSKSYVANARVAHTSRNSEKWGVHGGGEISVDLKQVRARKDDIVQQSRDGLGKWVGGEETLTTIIAAAKFTGTHEIEADGKQYSAERFFLNTGARAEIPPVPGLKEVALTNTSLLDLETLPRHLIVLGGGVVAVEFAQVFRRYGAEVTILQRGKRLLPREDDDVVEVIHGALKREGVQMRFGVNVKSVDKTAREVKVTLENGEVIAGSHVLAAAGRRPNSDSLNLEAAGVKVDAKGFIEVNDVLQTSAPHVWALGDVNGRGAFTHTSYNDYEIVESNLFGDDKRSLRDRIYIANIYVDPPHGRVGLTETEAKAQFTHVLKGVRPMSRINRARAKGETDGFIKVLVDETSKLIIGASIIGTDADEALHAIAAVMNARQPYTTLAKSVFAHPTVSELIPTTLQSLKPL